MAILRGGFHSRLCVIASASGTALSWLFPGGADTSGSPRKPGQGETFVSANSRVYVCCRAHRWLTTAITWGRHIYMF